MEKELVGAPLQALGQARITLKKGFRNRCCVQ
jgi:hypothetical protein